MSFSALLARLKEFQLPWRAGLYSIGLSLWRRISKTILSLWLSGHFASTSIFIGTSVPSRNAVTLWVRNFRQTASAAERKSPGREPSLRTAENIERLRQAFVRSPPLAGMCWQQGTPPHRHYIQEVNIIIKMLWDKDILVINSRKKTVYFSFYCNLKTVRFFCQTLYMAHNYNLSTPKLTYTKLFWIILFRFTLFARYDDGSLSIENHVWSYHVQCLFQHLLL